MNDKACEYLVNYSRTFIDKEFNRISDNGTRNPEVTKVMPLLLFKKIVDNIEIIKNLNDLESPGDASSSTARNILENYWSLLYMIKEDGEFRQLAYYNNSKEEEINLKLVEYGRSLKFYEEQLKEIKKWLSLPTVGIRAVIAKNKVNKNNHLFLDNYKKCINELPESEMRDSLEFSSDQEYKEFLDFYESNQVKNQEYSIRINQIRDEIEKVKEQEHTLNSNAIFDDVRREIEKFKKKTKKNYYTWYNLKSKISSVLQLAKAVREGDRYFDEYNLLSLETHSKNAINQILVDNNDGMITYKLNYKNENMKPLSIALNYLSKSIKVTMEYYGYSCVLQ